MHQAARKISDQDESMTITHIDCYQYRGQNANLDTSSYVTFNPDATPGSVVLAGARAVRQSIGSQVACRLSIEHFTEGILEHYADKQAQAPTSSREDSSLKALESAFKRANKSVYTFSHSLAAGGRLAAAFIGLVLQDDFIAAGRVAGGGAYLLRQGELFPFFETNFDSDRSATEFLGSQSMVSVELASVGIEPEDILLVFSEELSPAEQTELLSLMNDIDFRTSLNPALELSQFLFQDPKQLAFSILLKLGPQGIFLK